MGGPASEDPILAQLERIKANLSAADDSIISSSKASKKASVIAPASPSKKRAALTITNAAKKGVAKLKKQREEALQFATRRAQALARPSSDAEPAPSNGTSFLERATAAQRRKDDLAKQEEQIKKTQQAAEAREKTRSHGFGEAPKALGLKRDERLALIEELQMGPKDLPPNEQDPEWSQFEPYSGIRLKNRQVAHEDLTHHLEARYLIPPSLLYSIAKPCFNAHGVLQNGRDGNYEIPVDGDWLTIVVIAEKSPLMQTRVKGRQEEAGEDDDDDDQGILRFKRAGKDSDGKLNLDLESDKDLYKRARKTKADKQEENEALKELYEDKLANRSRKYFSLKLVDLTVNSQGSNGGSGRGDSLLSMMCFEADEINETVNHGTARAEIMDHLPAMRKSKRRYINGSRGAFELLHRLPEGTVIAVMNPRVRTPYKNQWTPESKARNNILTLNPRSAQDILVIGKAEDYARCEAIKKDGGRCTAFVDRRHRKSAKEPCVCDFHLGQAVGNLQRGRMDLANSTSGIGFQPNGRYEGDAVSANFGASFSSYAGIKAEGKKRKWDPEGFRTQAAHARKLNSSFGTMGDGLESNQGRTYAFEATQEAKPSDPSNFKFDINERLGRGKSEKAARLRKKLEAEELEKKMTDRFGDMSKHARPSEAALKKMEEASKHAGTSNNLIDPTSNAAKLLQDAKKKIDERKRKAEMQRKTQQDKKRRVLGYEVANESDKTPLDPLTSDKEPTPPPATEPAAEETTKKFVYPAEAIKLMGFDPLAGRVSQKLPSRDSRSALLQRTTHSIVAREPNLKIMKKHRPKVKTTEELEKEQEDDDSDLEFI